jgi:hypothetical protein
MIIANGKDYKIGIFDIETLKCFFDYGLYDPDTKEWIEFEISEYKNDLYKLVSFYLDNKFDYHVSFNGIGFDHQVLQFILVNYNDWYDLTNLQICEKIYGFVQQHIDNQKYQIPLPYKESDFPVKAIDLFKIHHFDNEARRTSLKWCAFMLNQDVEEMPIGHNISSVTPEQIDIIKSYRKNDCLVTEALLNLTIGNVDLEELKDYKGKNKIQDRFDVMKETGLQCLNWSDVKIGEEWNKLEYKLQEGIEDDSDLFTKNIKHPYGQKFSKFFPPTVQFKTDKLIEFQNQLGSEYVKNIKQEFPIVIGKTTYTVAKGGLHSTESHRKIETISGWITRDADVGSQYPNFIAKNDIYPKHLKPTIIKQFKEKITRRIALKSRAKKETNSAVARECMSVQEMLKLCLNGGYYGKLNQQGSFLEYPEGMLRVTIGCQMEILLLIEMLESAGITVISGNTDGVVSTFPESKQEDYAKVCIEWENIVGNNELGKLEYVDFSVLWQESINHYIAVKLDGSVKKKGRFMTEFEINKNKSKRIINLALEAYFVHKKDPIEFITSHKNIFDFCIAKKASGNMHYEEIIETDDRNNPEIVKHKKLIRYFVSKSGNVFMKRGFDYDGNSVNSHCEATDKDYFWMGQPKLKYFNKYYFNGSMEKYDIDYSYYILQTLKRIDSIEKTKKALSYANRFKTEQISLF